MRAAQALIESLEEEVASLRRDLEQASVALKAAQEEVAAREEALEENERARSVAEKKAREADGVITGLRIQSSNDQLELTNQHISELARLQDKFQEQLRTEIESALSTDDRDALVEEHRKVQESTKHRYEERIAELERSYQEAQEQLLEGEKEFDKRRASEIEALRREFEEQKRDLQDKTRQRLEKQLQEALRSASEEHEKELDELRRSFDDREQELQNEHQKHIEQQQAEFAAREKELEERIAETEEQHQAKLRELKSLAENREQDLKKTHSTRLAEAKSETEQRIESLRSQREADNKALRKRHEEDLARLRSQYEKRLEEAAESSRLELWTVEEKLEGIKLEKTSEAAAYRSRLRELEAALQTEKPEGEDTVIMAPAISEPEVVNRSEGEPDEETFREIERLQQRIGDLEAALSVSEGARDDLAKELEELRLREPEPANPDPGSQDLQETPEPPTEEPQDADDRSGEKVQELEARLREAQDESRRYAEELQQAVESLRRLSEPEQRMRNGISTFNASEHTRHVASISKALGLPRVRAEVDEETNKPVFTLLWEGISWRRYVAEPSEDLSEPRVYLLGGGEDPEEFEAVEQQEPNARIDAQGRIILGVQAR